MRRGIARDRPLTAPPQAHAPDRAHRLSCESTDLAATASPTRKSAGLDKVKDGNLVTGSSVGRHKTASRLGGT